MLRNFSRKLLRHPIFEPILRAAGVGILNRILSIAIRLFSVPLIINYLGPEKFGVLMTISSATGYTILLDLGLSSALINRITAAHADKDREAANRQITTGIVAMGGVAILAFCLSCLALPMLDWVSLFKLNTTSVADVRTTVIVAAALILLQLPLSLILRVPYMFQRGHISEAFLFVCNLVGFLGIVASVKLGASFAVLAVFMLGGQALAGVLLFGFLYARRYVSIKLESWRQFKQTLAESVKTGTHYLIMQVVSMLLPALQFSLLAWYKGAEAVAAYAILYQIMSALVGPYAAVAQPAWTRVAYYSRLNKMEEIRLLLKMHWRASAIYASIVVVVFFLFVNYGLEYFLTIPPAYTFSIKLGFAGLSLLSIVFGGGVGAFVLGMGLTREMTLISVIQFVIFILAVLLTVPGWGASGMVMSICTANAIAIPGVLFLLKKSL
jgi:O-antigen/teichoic acid export membrane protein